MVDIITRHGGYRTYIRKSSNISRTLVGNKIVDHSDVAGASPIAAAPTTYSLSTQHMASMNWTKTTARRDEEHLSFGIWCTLYQRFDDNSFRWRGFFLNRCYLRGNTSIFNSRHCGSSVTKPVNYEGDSNNIKCTLAQWKMSPVGNLRMKYQCNSKDVTYCRNKKCHEWNV